MNGVREIALAAGLIAQTSGSSKAQSMEEAARANVMAGVQICLMNIGTIDQLHPTFLAAGFKHETEDFGGGPDDILHWYHAPAQTASVAVAYVRSATECRVTTGHMGVIEGLPFTAAVLGQMMPGQFRRGGPDGQNVAPDSPEAANRSCSGYMGDLSGRNVWVEVGTAGQDPVCVEDGTLQIMIHM